MKKILIPIDYSNSSKLALTYAKALHEQYGFELCVLHVYFHASSDNLLPDDIALSLQQKEEKQHLDRLQQFCQPYPHERSDSETQHIPIRYLAKRGLVVDSIIAAMEENDIDLIVIGTRAKHRLLDYILGTVCTKLIRKSSKPVLIIPEQTVFRRIQKIAFATEVLLSKKPILTALHQFSTQIKASIHQVVIQQLPRDFSAQKEEVMDSSWLGEADPDFSKITVIRDASISRGIDYFIQQHEIDLLAMHLPGRSALQQFFHRSQTRQMALNSPLPLLIYRTGMEN